MISTTEFGLVTPCLSSFSPLARKQPFNPVIVHPFIVLMVKTGDTIEAE